MTIDDLIRLSLEEDIGTGDVTCLYLDPEPAACIAFMIAKEAGVLAGVEIAQKVFRYLDPNVKTTIYRKDGDRVKAGDEIMRLEGKPVLLLQAERTALNFIQRLSGIATKTARMVSMIEGTDVKLLDTRKTTPLLRQLEKYAVRVGGGYNHRFGLYDMILLKENHIRAAGNITEAVLRVKRHNTSYKIEIEVTNMAELEAAYLAGVDRVMLDNMPIDQIKLAVRKYRKKVDLEVSGGVTEANIRSIAKTGVHYISSGSMTHSYKSLDISLLFKE